MPGQVESLGVVPVIEDEGWAGYQHFTDATRLPFNVLTYPSHNCSMPSNDKIVPDLGKQLIAQEWTENSGIMGNQEKFTTMSGDELEVRVWSSEFILSLEDITGTFKQGEVVTDSTSGATATVVALVTTDPLFPDLILKLIVGTFSAGHTITGGTSGATAIIVKDNTQRGDVIEVLYTSHNPSSAFYNVAHFYPITLSLPNPIARGLHRYSFDQWFDTNLDPALSKNVPRLVWVNGNAQIYSWIGAIAEITLVTTVIDTGYTYLSVDSAIMNLSSVSGAFSIGEKVLSTSGSGGSFYVAALADLNTTVTMILVVETGSTPFPVGGTVTGQTSGVTGVIGKVTFPPKQITWGSLGFEAADPKVVINGAERTLLITGSPTPLGGYATPDISFSPTSPVVHPGDIAFSEIRVDDTSTPLDFCRNNKNNMYYGWWKSRQLFMSNEFNRDAEIDITFVNAVLDDLVIPVTSVFVPNPPIPYVAHSYEIRIISVASPNSYLVTRDGVVTGGTTIVAGTPFALDGDFPGLTAEFIQATGHTLNDTWTIQVTPQVTSAWIDFNYNLPTRLPGQGYIFRLPANFWTMDTQEDKMYVNTKFGEWGVINQTLSADLMTETVSLSPLKQASSLKVIDPWMTGHMEDDLVFVTIDKSLMDIGRQIFLEEPQDGYLSDPVKYDFLPCSFVGGSIKYINKKLFISSPEQGIMHCMDIAKKYWQPPKTFPEVGILSIIENNLVTHSNIRNQTFTMFASVSDNGQAYEVLAKTPFNAYFKLVGRKRIPARWDSKYSSLSFMEGYVTGNPEIFFTLFLSPNDSIGKSHLVKPIILNNPIDKASIGQGSLASHPLGNDLAIEGSYFNEIYRKFSPILEYYFIALQFACVSKNHSYSILSMAVNMSFSPTANNTLIGDRTLP